MKKFEEEFDKNVTSVALRQDGESVITVCDYNEAKAFGHGWISPEDHQAEIEKTELQNLKYREEIARMQMSLHKKNKAIKELNGAVKKVKLEREAEVRENQRLRGVIGDMSAEIGELKSQLEKQQPEIPEVPQFVADWIEYWKSSGRGVISIDRALTQGSNLGTFEKIHAWLDEYDEEGDEIIEDRNGVEPPNVTLFSRAWVNGYTVAKEKRFYLKNKLTGLNLVEEKTFSLTGKHVGERFRE
ncbi:DUF1642 domain-containing protein, partial [Lactococcus garvieae]